MFDVPLPGMPDPGTHRPPKFSEGARVTRSNNRRLCETCCEQIHRMGVQHAPYPNTARWRVTTAESTSFLCYVHKEERLSQ